MRASGILLHITSLPSPCGVGTMGAEAFAFIDFLKNSGQKYWQILPLGPTGFGDSPYQTFSAFSGNPYLIDLERLTREGLLTAEEIQGVSWGDDPSCVDFGALYENRPRVLRSAFARFRPDGEYVAFVCAQAGWLDDYCLFMALKNRFGGGSWTEWPEDVRLHKPKAVARYAGELESERNFHRFLQYEFFRQWKALRAYAHSRGVGIIGDVPLYMPLDCADVWAESDWFELDGARRPWQVAGVPPDRFSADGQLWGNPLYDWPALRADGYGWWLRRLQSAARLFDVIRIDHFRGLESYWAIPFGEATARNGFWRKGPGTDFVEAVKTGCPGVDFIAEDLGFMTPEVRALQAASGWPGMKVLQFAFNSREPSDYLPHNYTPRCVCYTGTHDNETLAQWLEELGSEDLAYARQYLGLSQSEGYCAGVLRGGMSSVAELFISQMQDWLELGLCARMNLPGTLGGTNWRWRMTPGQASPELAKRILGMTKLYGRI